MDGAKQGFSIPPCQSCHHALYLLPQKSEGIIENLSSTLLTIQVNL
jgi:hypothetical protein